MKTLHGMRLLAATGLAASCSVIQAAGLYTPVPASGTPVVGPGISAPDGVYGKEYSHDSDEDYAGAPDPEQVIAWDGIGGTANSLDYSDFPRMHGPEEEEVDAIANTRDALFDETLRDESHLIFSHDDMVAGYGFGGGGPFLVPVPSKGPIMVSGGAAGPKLINGAGEVSLEESGVFGGFSKLSPWASAKEVNSLPEPRDVDGLEVWGPEPKETREEPGAPVIGDADKYSLEIDSETGISVWNLSGTPYLPHSLIVSAVEKLLGPMAGHEKNLKHDVEFHDAINLDALMASDVFGDPDRFDLQDLPGGPLAGVADELVDQNGTPIFPFGPDGGERGDAVIFSIEQIVDELSGGYYATGSELFVIDSTGAVGFLDHGGHLWDKGHALSTFEFLGAPDEPNEQFRAVLDINAIEAIGEGLYTPPIRLPGDFNGDLKVDAADYAVWRNALGTTDPLSGNGNEVGPSMGFVDGADYDLWRSHYGAMASPAPVAAFAAAPEPTAAALLLLGLAGGVLPRKR